MTTMRHWIDLSGLRLHESVENDVEMRAKCLPAFHMLSRYVEQNPEGDFEVEIGTKGNFICFDPRKLGYDKAFGIEDTFVMLGQRKPNVYGISGDITQFDELIMDRLRYAMVFYCLKGDSPSRVYTNVNNTEFLSTFRHEFMHAMDLQRTRGSITGRERADPRKDTVGYYNDPAEFNAYFHDIAGKLSDILSEITTHKDDPEGARMVADIYGFTGDFKKDMLSMIGTDPRNKAFVQFLRDDRRKALLKRLYRLHKAVADALTATASEKSEAAA